MSSLQKIYSFAEIQHLQGADLYRAIFQSDTPERIVREMSAQAAYLALCAHGLESSLEFLQLVPESHYRVFLDLSLWKRDCVEESEFWRWLEVLDQEESLIPLQKFLRVIDPKVLTVICAEKVVSIVGEEKVDTPPADGYYTPDGGYTWVAIQLEDENRHRLFARLLAFVYQTSPELFYQLLNEAQTSTRVELEEEGYQEKTKRLLNEGFPDGEICAQIHAPLSLSAFRSMSGTLSPRPALKGSIVPVSRGGLSFEPLASLLVHLNQDEAIREEVNGELALILNAALMVFQTNMAEYDDVLDRALFVQGVINIGLERAMISKSLPAESIYQMAGFQLLYRLGLHELRELQRSLRQVLHEDLGFYENQLSSQPVIKKMIEGVFHEDGARKYVESEGVESQNSGSFRPFFHLQELEEVTEAFRETFSH